MNLNPGIMIAILFPIAFVGMWVMLMWFFSKQGGWSELAEQFPDDPAIERNNLRWKSIRLGWVGYNNCMTMGFSDWGLHLSIPPPFKMFHPNLLIPWDQFHSAREKSLFFFRWTEAYIGHPTIAQMTAPHILFEEMQSRQLTQSDDFTD